MVESKAFSAAESPASEMKGDSTEVIRDIFDSFTLYISALSHKLRTPLSVISNDLQYWRNVHNLEDVDRSLNRCREISEILRSIDDLIQLNPSGPTVELKQALVNEIEGVVISNPQGEKELWVRASRLPAIFELLATILGLVKSEKATKLEIINGAKAVKIELKKEAKSAAHFSVSCSAKAARELGHPNSIFAPLLDFLLLSVGATAQYTCSADAFIISLSFPKELFDER